MICDDLCLATSYLITQYHQHHCADFHFGQNYDSTVFLQLSLFVFCFLHVGR